MKCISTAVAITLLALMQQAAATINYGKSSLPGGDKSKDAYDVAWIDGEDPCQWTYISNADQNPCGRTFTLSNGFSYHLEGCGTSAFALYNSDGSLNSKAKSKGGVFDGCVNSKGRYKVHQEWQF